MTEALAVAQRRKGVAAYRPPLARLAGGAAMAAAALVIVTQVVDFLMLDAGDNAGPVVVNSVLKLVAFFLLSLGLLGLYARQAEAAGAFGLVGFLVAFLGTMLVAGDLWFETFAVPYLTGKTTVDFEQETPGGMLLVGGTVSVVLFALGWVLFALASLRARVAPARAAILLVVGGLSGVGIITFPFAGIPLALAVAWMGYWLYAGTNGAGDEAGAPTAAHRPHSTPA